MTARAPGRIKVRSDYPFAFAEVLDANRRNVGFGTGSFDVMVAPGIYLVRAYLAGNKAEQLTRVPAGEDRLIAFPQLAPVPPLRALGELDRPVLGEVPIAGTSSAVARVRRTARVRHAPGDRTARPGAALGVRLAARRRWGDCVDEAPAAVGHPCARVQHSGPGAPPTDHLRRTEPRDPGLPLGCEPNCPRLHAPAGSGYDPGRLDEYAATDTALDAFVRGTGLPAAVHPARDSPGPEDPLSRLLGAWAAFVAGDVDAARAACPVLARALLKESAVGRTSVSAALQPGSYWAVDMANGVRLIAIDAGLKGRIDREQGEWLLRVSSGDGPKVLLAATPLCIADTAKAVPIDWGPSGAPVAGFSHLDAVVRCKDRGFVAAIAGGVGNYQRLTVKVTDPGNGEHQPMERTIEYVTAGGTGAPITATHRIDQAVQAQSPAHDSVKALDGSRIRCYPTRGDSLARFGSRSVRRVFTLACVSLGVLALSLGALAAWAVGFVGRFAHGLVPVAAASLIGFAGIPLLVAVAVWLARKAFPSGYRKLGVVFVFAWLVAPWAVVLASALGEGWNWFWQAALLGLGAAASTFAIGLIWVWLLLGSARWDQDRFLVRTPPSAWRCRLDLTASMIALTVAVPTVLLISFQDTWAARVLLAGFLTSVAFVSGLFLAVVTTGGRRALWDGAVGDGVDPDMALSYLHWLGIAETLPRKDDQGRLARVGDFDYRTARICDLLLPGARGPRAWVNACICAMTTIHMPPMFRSFVSLSIEDGALLLTCHGVTGWAEHETNAPREDCVRIRLPDLAAHARARDR